MMRMRWPSVQTSGNLLISGPAIVEHTMVILILAEATNCKAVIEVVVVIVLELGLLLLLNDLTLSVRLTLVNMWNSLVFDVHLHRCLWLVDHFLRQESLSTLTNVTDIQTSFDLIPTGWRKMLV